MSLFVHSNPWMLSIRAEKKKLSLKGFQCFFQPGLETVVITHINTETGCAGGRHQPCKNPILLVLSV